MKHQDITSISEHEMALTFSMDGEILAIPVAYVSEIIDPLPLTPAPATDDFAPGLVNVRGVIAPFLDMRQRLGMKPAAQAESTRALVLELNIESERTIVAVEVDAVYEIMPTALSDIEPVPDLGIRWPRDLIKGVIRKESSLVILLDIESTFAPSRTQTSNRPTEGN